MDTTETPRLPSPVDSNERAQVLDVIRGFALGGVFLSNVYIWMSGLIFVTREQATAAFSSTLGKIIEPLYSIFVGGKFMTMFTFLFGLGLSVQFSRAEARNDSSAKRYARRCLALVFLGVLHLTFLWYGDITHQYALIGLLVLLFRNRSTKTLLITGLALTLFVVPAALWGMFSMPRYLHSPEVAEAADAARMVEVNAFNAQILEAFKSSSYPTIIGANLKMYVHQTLSPIVIAYDFANLGNFLLGMAIGRLGWFQDVPAHRRAFKHLLGWNALITVIAFATNALIHVFIGKSKGPPADLHIGFSILMPFMRNLMTLSLAIVYMSAIALLFQRKFFQRILSIYAPAGRMAVTNYFMQSAIGLIVFTGIGFGYIGDLRLRFVIVLPLVMFGVQMIFSWLWLRHFRFGPVEWISRSITYGKLQPMRYAPENTPEVSP
jgi:uncharacterized protein